MSNFGVTVDPSGSPPNVKGSPMASTLPVFVATTLTVLVWPARNTSRPRTSTLTLAGFSASTVNPLGRTRVDPSLNVAVSCQAPRSAFARLKRTARLRPSSLAFCR